MSNFIGQIVSTGNSVINQLPVGAVLTVTAKGQFQVTSVPKPVFAAGDKVYVISKQRYATIFRATTNTTKGINGQPPDGVQFYVSTDAPYVIREADESDLRKL